MRGDWRLEIGDWRLEIGELEIGELEIVCRGDGGRDDSILYVATIRHASFGSPTLPSHIALHCIGHCILQSGWSEGSVMGSRNA